MDFADLRPRPEGNGVAQTGWSGCAPLEADWAFASVHNIIASLPRRQSRYWSLASCPREVCRSSATSFSS
jgi:hypothetical protein